MSREIEVINNILALLVTIEDGLNYTKKQLEEIRYEEAFSMLHDVIEGIISIEHALKPMEYGIHKLKDEEFKKNILNLNLYINETVTFYMEGKFDRFEKSLNQVREAFHIWREYTELNIREGIAS